MQPLPIAPERLFADTQWLQRVARSLVRDPEAAADLAQETWLTALRQRGGAVANRRAWLRRLLLHRLVSTRRKEAARRAREADAARSEALPSTAELCERAELQRVLGEAMLALEEPFRTTVLLRFLEGLAPNEIAARQGVPANTVRWRLRRGIATLEEKLEREMGRNWALALLPFARPRGDALAAGTAATTTSLGVTFMLKKSLFVGGALVAAAFLVVSGLRRPALPATVSPGSSGQGELLTASVPAEEEVEPTPGARLAVASATEGESAPPVETRSTPATATIVFEAVARESGRPLAGVAAMPEVRDRALVEYAEAKTHLSDASGELRYVVPADEVVHVQAWGEDPPAGLAVLDVGPLAPDEVLRVRLELSTAVDVTFVGRVVDETSGEPLADVPIVPKQPSGLAAAIEEARTDPAGFFELRVPSWRTAFFHATYAGYGRIAFVPQQGHDTRSQALELELPRASAVEGQVDAGHLSGAKTRVVFEANTWDVQRPRPERAVYFVKEVWSADVEASGRYRIDGLNGDARYQAKLLVGDQVVRELSEEVVLRPGETRTLDWLLGRGATVFGDLVDQDGEPLADAEIWLVATRWEHVRRFHPNEGRGARRTTTDDAGRFAFEDVAAGGWLVGSGLADEGPRSRIASWAVTIQLEPGDERRQVRLQTWRDLELHGLVLDPEGLPAPRCKVTLVAEDGPRWTVTTDGEGRFEARGLRALRYTLTAGGMGAGYARSDPVTLAPGVREVELRLAPSGSIRGRVLGAKGLDALGMVRVSARRPPNPYDDWMSVGVRVDGYFSIDGLAPGIYDLFVNRKDERCAFLAGHRVAPGPALDELELTLEAGGRLAPRLADGVRWASYELFLDGAFVAYGKCDAERTETHLVPPGTLEVRFRNDQGHEGTTLAEVRAGRTTEVEVGRP